MGNNKAKMKSQIERRMTTVGKCLNSSKTALTTTMIVVACISFTGCGKQLAKWDMDKAEKLIHQAMLWNAPKYDQSKSSFEAANSALKNAQQAYSGDDADGAKAQAKEAVASAKSALESATAQFAADEVDAAKKSMEVARANDGPMENQPLFDRAEKASLDMDTAYSKQKFEKTIKISAEIQNDVVILMAAKKAAADTRLAELKDLRDSLDKAKASVYNATALNLLDEQIVKYTNAVVKERQYKKAFADMTATVTQTHEAIAETKKRNCEDLLQQAQKSMDEAIENEANLFARENLTTCQNLMTETLAAFWDKQYDTAITSAEKLRGDAQRLVYESRIESARDKIAKANTQKAKFEDEKIEKYIPGRISSVTEMIKKSEDLFANNEFQSAKLTANDALAELARMDEAFNDLAFNEIEKATAVEAIAKKTYSRMNEVFSNDQLWASAEARRLINEANLGARLDEAEKMLSGATQAREIKKYSKAIEDGKLASTQAAKVEDDTYGVTARYTLLRVQNELSVLERQQAIALAPVQVSEINKMIVNTQALLDQKQTRNAVEAAACARSYIENIKQEMIRKTNVEQNRSEHMVNRLVTGDIYDGTPGGSDTNRYDSMLGGGLDVPGVPVTNAVPAAATTNNPLSENVSGKSYEKPTEGAPFVVQQTQPAQEDQSTTVRGLWGQVDALINDEIRIQHVRKYYPASIADAKTAIQESQRKLEAQDYAGAYEAAVRAQRTVLEAESKASRKAAQTNLSNARNKMNMAKSAGSQMFAPAAMNEAANLISEAQKMINAGNNVQAYEVSQRAVEAAEKARNYNVVKARETGALALRYGGNMSQHPLLTDSQINADLAEGLLKSSRPECRLEGQEVAKLAVYQSQLALDHARDWTFQERIDNLYKALNNATSAGANWFNPVEVKRLVEELHDARCEYNTRNFDAVEIKLNDIEASLARVIETTPQILEQNLSQQTDRLNALLDAGAESYSAQAIDDAKSFMNNSVIDFRNKSYGSSYNGMRKAIEKVDEVELTMQEQVYFDAVTEIFDQLDDAFVRFTNVIETGPAFLKRLVASPTGARASISLSGRMNPNEYFDTINNIYLRTIHLAPPKGKEGMHEQVVKCVQYARTSAMNFQKLYVMDQFDGVGADDVIDTAYDQLNKAKRLRAELQFRSIDAEARKQVFKADKIVNY